LGTFWLFPDRLIDPKIAWSPVGIGLTPDPDLNLSRSRLLEDLPYLGIGSFFAKVVEMAVGYG
jgi:hypothetical protein